MLVSTTRLEYRIRKKDNIIRELILKLYQLTGKWEWKTDSVTVGVLSDDLIYVIRPEHSVQPFNREYIVAILKKIIANISRK